MKLKYIVALALLTLAALPLAAQKTVRVRRAPTAVIADFDSPASRSYLGVGVSDLSSDRVSALKLKDDRGVEVTQVDQEAPAGKAGFKEHDVIVGFNGTPVESQEQFKRLMRETPPGRTVSVEIMRDGQQQNLKVQLADRKQLESQVFVGGPNFVLAPTPPMPPMAVMPAMPAMPDFPRAWTDQTIMRVRSNSGATLESLTSQLGDYFGVKNGEGMLVRSVQKGSAAETAGLRAGDVIVRVGDQRITDNSDWREAMRNSKDGKVAVVIVRDKKEQTLSLSVPIRRGPDSSALNDNDKDCPDAEMAMESAEDALENVSPLVEESVETGLDAAAQALQSAEANKAFEKSMKELQRQLTDNRRQLQNSIASSMKMASSQLKARQGEIDQAMRELKRNLENLHWELGSGMQ